MTLVATRTLTVAMAHASKGKMVTLPRTLNLSTGKDSMCQTGFSDMAWGKATRCYATSVRSLANTKFDAIIQEAREFMKPIQSRGKTTKPTEIINIDDCDDERACLIDNSGSDEECKLSLRLFPSVTSLTLIIQNGSLSPTTYCEFLLLFPHTMCLPYHHARFNSGSSCLPCFSQIFLFLNVCLARLAHLYTHGPCLLSKYMCFPCLQNA